MRNNNRDLNISDISDETGLVPPPEGENERLLPESSYNFLSECFYMTHFCLKLGFHVVHERFLKLNREVGRIQEAYRNIAESGGQNTDVGRQVIDKMDKSKYISETLCEDDSVRCELCYVTIQYFLLNQPAPSKTCRNDQLHSVSTVTNLSLS